MIKIAHSATWKSADLVPPSSTDDGSGLKSPHSATMFRNCYYGFCRKLLTGNSQRKPLLKLSLTIDFRDDLCQSGAKVCSTMAADDVKTTC